MESAPKGLPQIDGDKEGKASSLPPRSSPAAITPAKPASSAAAQPRTVEPQQELMGDQTPLQSPGMPVAQTPQAGGSATPEVMHTPLFTEEQVREIIVLRSRTPWLHGDRPSRSFFPALRRPSFLETEEARMTAESTEMSTMRAYMAELIAQNEKLTKRVQALETRFSVREVDLSFSTPNGSEPPEVSKEPARPPEALKEAARPPGVSKEAARPPEALKEAARPSEVSKEAARPREGKSGESQNLRRRTATKVTGVHWSIFAKLVRCKKHGKVHQKRVKSASKMRQKMCDSCFQFS